MGVPATLADLDPIAANNSPSGSDPIGTNLDDYLRSHAALIKQVSFASGTRMPFAQAAAPTGWTQDVSDNANNRMLRVVNTAGGGVAGSSSPILNNVVPAHTHGFSTGTASADHTHSGSTGTESADHSHAWTIYKGSTTGGTLPSATPYAEATGTGSSGGRSAAHYHSFTTGGISANHSHSGSTDNGSSQTNWTPRYINMIICTKD